MSSTKSTGIRIPLELYEKAISVNPDKTFSEIVTRALEEKYSSTSDAENGSTISNDIYSEIDKVIDVHIKKKEGYFDDS